MDGKGVSVKWQSRRGLSPPSSRQGWWSRYSNTSPTVVPGLSTCGCGRLSWTIVTQARTHSRSSGTGSRSTAAPSAGAGMCSTVLRFFHFLYWTIVTQGPCWRRHRERERHAPPFLTVVTVFSTSLSLSQLLRQSRDCTWPPYHHIPQHKNLRPWLVWVQRVGSAGLDIDDRPDKCRRPQPAARSDWSRKGSERVKERQRNGTEKQ